MDRGSFSITILVVIAASITAGCTRDQESIRSVDAAAAYEARFETLIIPDGTNVVASLDTRLSTETNHTGDRFVITTIEPIIVEGRPALPSGARIHGALRDVQRSGRTKGRARMTLIYQGIVDAEGMTRKISALPLTLQAASATPGDVEKIAAGGVLGAIVGGIAGGTKGAVVGAGAGAAAGAIIMLATEGDEVEIEAGQQVYVQITSSTRIQVLAQR